MKNCTVTPVPRSGLVIEQDIAGGVLFTDVISMIGPGDIGEMEIKTSFRCLIVPFNHATKAEEAEINAILSEFNPEFVNMADRQFMAAVGRALYMTMKQIEHANAQGLSLYGIATFEGVTFETIIEHPAVRQALGVGAAHFTKMGLWLTKDQSTEKGKPFIPHSELKDMPADELLALWEGGATLHLIDPLLNQRMKQLIKENSGSLGDDFNTAEKQFIDHLKVSEKDLAKKIEKYWPARTADKDKLPAVLAARYHDLLMYKERWGDAITGLKRDIDTIKRLENKVKKGDVDGYAAIGTRDAYAKLADGFVDSINTMDKEIALHAGLLAVDVSAAEGAKSGSESAAIITKDRAMEILRLVSVLRYAAETRNLPETLRKVSLAIGSI
ncbi:MAG: hypothetical protein ACTSUE_18335, partial [Promethearchaeota archaeon]